MYVAVRRPTRCAEQRTIRGSPAQAKKVPSQLNNTKRADQSKGMYWTLLLSLSLRSLSLWMSLTLSFPFLLLSSRWPHSSTRRTLCRCWFHFISDRHLLLVIFVPHPPFVPDSCCLSWSPSPVLTHVLALYLVVCCSFIFQPKTVLSQVICCSCHLLLPSSYPTVLTHRTVVVLPHSF
jgi:hypothetical protein